MKEANSNDNYDAKTLLLNDSNGNELFCYLEQLVSVDGQEYALLTPVDTPVSPVSYTHLTLPTKLTV